MPDLQTLWKKFSATPFPRSAHESDLQLESLDAEIAGCVSSFLQTHTLEREKKEILEKAVKRLQENFENIPIDSQDYFRQLEEIGEQVLGEN